MIVSPHIASGGGDIIPVIIIIAAIIAQIVKAVKGPRPAITPPSSPGDGGDFTASENELRKFLENLAGEQSVKETVIPPPLPTPVARNEPSHNPSLKSYKAAAHSRAQREKTRAVPTFETPASEHVFEIAPPPLSSVSSARATNIVHTVPSVHRYKKQHPIRTTISLEMKGRDSLRKAILLREILGPCIALRRPGNLPSGI